MFLIFSNFLSDKVETLLWKSEAKCSTLFKSKFSHRKLLRAWFWSFLELKNKCSERLKRAFSSFLKIFEWRSWNRFLGKRGKASKTIYNRSSLQYHFLTWRYSNGNNISREKRAVVYNEFMLNFSLLLI